MLHVRLNPVDHFPPGNYATCCLYLQLKPDVTPAQAFAILHEGLLRTFRQLPWLSGKIYPMAEGSPGWRPGNLEIRYDPDRLDDAVSERLRLNELPATGPSYEDLREQQFPTDAFPDEELIWAPPLPDVSKGAACVVAQANFLPGGCLLCFGVNHYASDGNGTVTIWKLWADHCVALQDTRAPPPVAPAPECSDRDVLRRIWTREGTVKPREDIGAASWAMWDLEPPGKDQQGVVPHDVEAQGYKSAAANMPQESMTSAIFYFTPVSFASLLERCAHDEGRRVSSNDALCGLVWRCLLKARRAAALEAGRDLDGVQSRLYLTLDARPEFSTALPSPYLGNLSVMNRCSMALETLAAPGQSLGAVASHIRAVAEAAHTEALLDAFAVADGTADLGDLTLRGSGVRGFDMLLASLLTLPVDEMCFGGGVFGGGDGGRPEAFRPLMGGFNRFSRLCFVLPRKKHGGVEAIVNLFEREMEFLLEDDEFGRYAMYLTS
ncbi:hypothetical protein LZ31DRAFT_72109 [Colletotrichum somersetense]|nr:hypothetical protein LZ31DRAFT_72109 [Colletotrichum somersetense]